MIMETTCRLFRKNTKRDDGLSESLQISKAAEHLVCAELLLRGWNAFLADAGLPYDVVVDIGGERIACIQVKSTTRMYERPIKPGSTYKSPHPHYRFALRRSRTGDRRITLDVCDYLALVALDRKLIAWLSVDTIRQASGKVLGIIEMKTRQINYISAGNRGPSASKCGKFMEDFSSFDPK